jgi:hypothetical protein
MDCWGGGDSNGTWLVACDKGPLQIDFLPTTPSSQPRAFCTVAIRERSIIGHVAVIMLISLDAFSRLDIASYRTDSDRSSAIPC